MDPEQSKDVNYQPAFNNPDYWNKPNGQNEQPATPPTVGTGSPVTQTPATQPAQTTPSILEPNQNTASTMTTPPVTPKAPGSSNGLMIIMVVLVIVLLGATGLFAFQDYQLRQQSAGTVQQPSSSPLTQASTAPDQYADWKVYSNQKYGFNFKYPSQLAYLSDGIAKNGPLLLQDYDGTKSSGDPTKNFQLAMYVTTDKTTVTLDQFAAKTSTGSAQLITLGTNQVLIGQSIQKNVSVPTLWFKNGTTFIRAQDSTPNSVNASWFNSILTTLTFGMQSGSSPLPYASITPSASPISNACGTGMKQFTNSNVTFCYPDTLKETSASTTSVIVLSDGSQTLKVTQNFQGGWGGSPCLFIDKTTVSGYASKRLSWKKQNADGTCQNVFTSFAEMVNEGNFTFPFPYAVELTNQKGTYADNTMFLAVEQSFKVLTTGSSSQ